jgi:hypothetical protein
MKKMELLKKTMNINVNIAEIRRIGKKLPNKSRPLIVKFENFKDKLEVLKSAKKLKNLPKEEIFSSISIQFDLTKQQQIENKLQYEELKRRRDGGEKVFIRGGLIINIDNQQQI